MRNKPSFVNIILHILAFSLCIVPPALATVFYFPVWVDKGSGYALAGGGVLLLVIFALPLFRRLSLIFAKATPYVLWLSIFLIFFGLSKIASEMAVISFAGFIGNLLGAFVFRIRDRRRELEKRRI